MSGEPWEWRTGIARWVYNTDSSFEKATFKLILANGDINENINEFVKAAEDILFSDDV